MSGEQKRTIEIFVTADIGGAALDRLRERGYVIDLYPDRDPPPKAKILEKVASGVDALITTLRDPIDSDVISAGGGTLRVIAQMAVGIDNIDRAVANSRRIPFTNTADVLTEATAEFAMFMLGAVSRKLYTSEKLVEENQWGSWHPYHPVLGDEVTGKTVAVIGVGRIGKAFAKKCLGLDMNLLLCGRKPDEEFAAKLNGDMRYRYDAGFSPALKMARYVSFREAIAGADYVSPHVPLIMPGQGREPTYRLIDKAALGLMKPTAYLINTARGAIVDEQALFSALMENRIAGAALDVFETEPLPPDSPLRDPRLRHRLRLFHHFASGTNETRLSPDPDIGMAGRAVQAVIDVLEDRYDGDPAKMPFVVNKEAFR